MEPPADPPTDGVPARPKRTEPLRATPARSRPVWVVPTIAASVGVLLLAVVTKVTDGGDDQKPAPTTTTSTVPTTVALDPAGPGGSRTNPYPVGTSIAVAGWRITVQSVGGAGDTLTAEVLLRWDGRDDSGPGVLRELVLRIGDVHGRDHALGGRACTGDPAGALAALPDLDVSRSTSASLCWTVPAAERPGSALQIGVKGQADVAFLAVG